MDYRERKYYFVLFDYWSREMRERYFKWAAPRGSKTGTQGLKGSKERSVIPRLLCEHIVDICEGEYTDECINFD